MSHGYGWLPDLPDHRDFRFTPRDGPPPPKVDLRPGCPPCFDQGNLGSCTANAIANAHRFSQMKQGAPVITPSRLFTYWNARAYENTVQSDAGCSIRDGMKSIVRLGVCSEADWPYLPAQFTQKPVPGCFVSALDHQALVYRRVEQTLADMKACLASGFPFVFGFTVYEGFESDEVARTGLVGMPGSGEGMLGGHAVLCVGYNDANRRFLIQNSWGASWGYRGFFAMPFSYLTNPDLASDFWTMSVVEA